MEGHITFLLSKTQSVAPEVFRYEREGDVDGSYAEAVGTCRDAVINALAADGWMDDMNAPGKAMVRLWDGFMERIVFSS